MKIRILDDSIRLRLSQSDVALADERGVVEGRTRFPDGSAFTYALETVRQGKAGASYGNGRMLIRLPAAEVSGWANDDTAVSLESTINLPEGGSLRILVEKDFQCLTARGDEDQSDLFVNPEASEC